ncbi:MAG: alcohol dehydrogenase catalytic domain-containing protein [Heliobacteriaceae bacterium]|jgi:threonine dehydrogenase-like Zn-dependent dehydrogenase|nr:alcohol dehydrogenase catalytic domain-containing protein [Heliobacteriaceae bacterium]
MKAVIFDKELKYTQDYKKPVPQAGEALVKVTTAGICNTDYEITKGYMGYAGVLGHEGVGIVEEVNGKDQSLLGKRVVPEISYGCKKPDCIRCAQKMYRHCPARHTLGIVQKDGCFAEYFTMPVEVLFEVPDNVTDEQAVFTEPLAAALEINEQLHIKPYQKTLVLGDGKLGLITALALNAQNINVTLAGKHQNKLDIAKKQGVDTTLLGELEIRKEWDVVVEATGSISGFETAIALTVPRGVLVLKSTVAGEKPMNLAPVVIDEITVLGSRCGQFPAALRMLKSQKIDFSPLISGIYDAKDAVKAFEKNKEKDTLKILLKF